MKRKCTYQRVNTSSRTFLYMIKKNKTHPSNNKLYFNGTGKVKYFIQYLPLCCRRDRTETFCALVGLYRRQNTARFRKPDYRHNNRFRPAFRPVQTVNSQEMLSADEASTLCWLIQRNTLTAGTWDWHHLLLDHITNGNASNWFTPEAKKKERKKKKSRVCFIRKLQLLCMLPIPVQMFNYCCAHGSYFWRYCCCKPWQCLGFPRLKGSSSEPSTPRNKWQAARMQCLAQTDPNSDRQRTVPKITSLGIFFGVHIHLSARPKQS